MCGSDLGIREKVLKKLRAIDAPYAEELADFCVKLEEAIKPRMVVLHGSVAKGLHGVWSDVDVVVVADFKQRFLDRVSELLELAPPSIPLEVLAYTPEEFESMFERFNPFVLDVVNYGIALVGEEELERFKARLADLKRKGLKRTKSGWRLPEALGVGRP